MKISPNPNVDALRLGYTGTQANTNFPTILPADEYYARNLLKERYVFMQDVAYEYGFRFSKKQIYSLVQSMPSKKKLEELSAINGILIPTIERDCSLAHFRDIIGQPYYPRGELYFQKPTQKFFHSEFVGTAKWLLIGERPCSGSLNQTWEFQQNFLTGDDYFPSAIEIMYALTTYYRIRCSCQLSEVYFRTSSVSDKKVNNVNQHIIVGGSGTDGLVVQECENDIPWPKVGVLRALKNDNYYSN